MSTESSLSAMTVERLLNRLDALGNQVERQQLSQSQISPKPKTWWESATQFIGLPAAALALIFVFTQIQTERTTPALNNATIEKTNAEREKTRIETAKLSFELSKLEADRSAGRKADLEKIDELIPRLRVSLQNVAQQNLVRDESAALIVRYIILTITLMAIGLFADIVLNIWSALVNFLSNIIYNQRPQYPNNYSKDPDQAERQRRDYDREIRKHERLVAFWRHGSVLLGPLPNLLIWAIRAAVFVSVAIPLFDQLAIVVGSPVRFEQIAELAMRGEVSSAIAALRRVVTGG